MYKNYFYLLRAVRELEPLLKNKQIIEAYTQEKDKLFLHISDRSKPNFHLIISVNPQQPFILFKDEHHKAKKNVSTFFSTSLPMTIISIKIALGDRIICFESMNSKLVIVFRGGISNIYLINTTDELFSFKKVNPEEKHEFRKEIENVKLIKSPENILTTIQSARTDALRKLPYFGKEILREAEFRNNDLRENLIHIIEEIQESPISVYFNEMSGKPSFIPVAFKSFKSQANNYTFNNYFDALNKYFSISFKQTHSINIRRNIEKYLHTEIEKLSNKLNSLKARIELGSKEEFYRNCGNLLLSNINLLLKGMKEIILEEGGNAVKIKLDEKKSPHINIQHYFEKSRGEKIDFEKSILLFNKTDKEYKRLIEIRKNFEMTDDVEDLNKIKKELKLKEQSHGSQDNNQKNLFRHFLVDGKYHIYVGKDSKNNDLLTTKFAKQNDFWFHARSVSGSHVVLRVENSKEQIPKNILKKVSAVAAFYSKAKTSGLVPVVYALKKYVTKNKRHEPGQVSLIKENVLLVKPEIPSGCEAVLE